MIKVLQAPLFDYDYHVVYGSQSVRSEDLELRFSKNVNTRTDYNKPGAFYTVIERATGNMNLVVELSTNATILTVSHEALHLATKIMEIAGAKDEEVLCHLHSKLMFDICNAVSDKLGDQISRTLFDIKLDNSLGLKERERQS